MKLVHLTTCYGQYLKNFYIKHPNLIESSYHEQLSHINFDGFGWADFFSVALDKLGYNTSRLIANGLTLQRAWARENGVTVEEEQKNWFLDITMRQIILEKPEILFVGDHITFKYEWLQELRERCPSVQLIIGWCGAPFADDRVFKSYDIILSCVPELVETFNKLGHTCYHMNHSFEPRILERTNNNSTRKIDFSFVGSLVQGEGYHNERKVLLEGVSELTDLSICTPSLIEGALQPFLRPAVFGIEMFQTLRDSAVSFNSHIDISPKSASNMRLWEATGMGSCLLTDWKPNLNNLLEEDFEVVAYRSVEECNEKVKWLLEHPKEREAIATAGQKRCLRDHTISHRASQLNEIINNYMLS